MVPNIWYQNKFELVAKNREPKIQSLNLLKGVKIGTLFELLGSNKHASVKPVNWPRDVRPARREGKGGGKRAIFIAHSPEMALEASERVIVSALPPTQAK